MSSNHPFMINYTGPIQLKSNQISLDSRQINDPENTAFFAVKGIHHDGHQHIEPLYLKGVREFVVEKHSWNQQLTEKSKKWIDANIFVVNNTIEALQNWSIEHRNQFDLPIVAITGSNGKTCVKEWLSSLLNGKFQIVKSPKSYNSQIGVQLSILKIKKKTQMVL